MSQGFIKGILFGATAGSLGGLLLAPQSGQKTQEKVKEKLEKTADSFDETAEVTKELKDSIQNFSKELLLTQEVIQETIPFIKSSLKKDMDAFSFQVEPRLERINEQSEHLKEHLTSLDNDDV